jgi:dihydroorotase
MAIVFCGNVFAKEITITKKQLPSVVINSFNKAYPNAEIKNITKETSKGKTYYEIESMKDNTNLDVLYNNDGTPAEIEDAIPSSELPISVLNTLKQQYPNKKITKAERITKKSSTEYEVVLGKKIEVVLDSEGKIIKPKK